MDITDFKILQAMEEMGTAFTRAEKLVKGLKISPDDLEARLGLLEMEGLVQTRSDAGAEGSLPSGITAAKLTNNGRRALSGPRW